jgi:hypothetical protein
MLERHSPMRYELWQSADGCVQTCFREDNEAARAQIDIDTRMIWSCVAESYVEAQQKRHAYLGFEPYKPPEDWGEE